jgi:hypothetical protein
MRKFCPRRLPKQQFRSENGPDPYQFARAQAGVKAGLLRFSPSAASSNSPAIFPGNQELLIAAIAADSVEER